MRITLDTSNAFSLELESGKSFRVREDGEGRLAVTTTTTHNCKTVISLRQGFEVAEIGQTSGGVILT